MGGKRKMSMKREWRIELLKEPSSAEVLQQIRCKGAKVLRKEVLLGSSRLKRRKRRLRPSFSYSRADAFRKREEI